MNSPHLDLDSQKTISKIILEMNLVTLTLINNSVKFKIELPVNKAL